MADQSDQLALVPGLDPQDAKAILGVLVSDALDQCGEHLVIGWRGLVLHDGRHTLAVLSKSEGHPLLSRAFGISRPPVTFLTCPRNCPGPDRSESAGMLGKFTLGLGKSERRPGASYERRGNPGPPADEHRVDPLDGRGLGVRLRGEAGRGS